MITVSHPESDLQKWMAEYSIPHEQAAGIMTAAKLEDTVVVTKEIENIQMMVIVTAGVENAVDITKSSAAETAHIIGSMNMMLFIDAHFTDGALVDGYMAATEAKVKALQDFHIVDSHSDTIATGHQQIPSFLPLHSKG